jgi:phosphodiesterase/alkaline phosphatase D-like protein
MIGSKFMLHLIFAMICIGLLTSPAKAATLTHYPMVGAATDSTVNIWLRSDAAALAIVEYQPAGENWSQPLQSAAVSLAAENDFTGTVSLTNLSAGSLYDYRIRFDGAIQPGTSIFKTLPSQGTPAQFTFVFGADIQQDQRPHTVFGKIAARRPDFAVLIGDTA